MKTNILFIATISILFLACNSQQNSIPQKAENQIGIIKGNDFRSNAMIKFMDAYVNKDAQLMIEMSADTVKFHPADVGGVFDVDTSNTDFIVERQKNWDSLSRDYVFIMPMKLEDSKVRVVTTAFNEKRYVNDGTVESINFYERLYINADNKISRVVQYSRPPNE